MTRRLSFLVALVALVLATPLVEGAPGDGTKKLQGALGKVNAIKADESVGSGDPRLAELGTAIEAVAQQGDEEAAKALLGLLLGTFPNATVEIYVAEHARDGLQGMAPGAGRDELRAQLEKKKRDLRIAAPLAEVISGWDEEASVRALADLLTQRDDRLIMSGARGLARLGRKEGVRPLIAAFGALKEKGGEPLEVVGAALFHITGQAFRTEEDWTKWWDTEEATWDPSKKQGGTAGGTRTRPVQTDAPSLFESVTIRSKKVVLVLDISGSMHIRNYVHDPIEPPPPPPSREPREGTAERDRPAGSQTGGGDDANGGDAGGGGAPQQGPPLPPGVDPNAPGYKPKPCTFSQCPGAKGTGPACPSDENLPTWYRRHDRLMRQVAAVVRAFKNDVQFNMVAFSSDARTWRGNTLVAATDSNKRNAQQWIESLQPSGATLAVKALETAFEFQDADTIIFVTDGAPTNPAGRPYDPSRWRELLDEVKRLNKVRKVRIDVISIAEGHTDFARGLASENGGEYTTVP